MRRTQTFAAAFVTGLFFASPAAAQDREQLQMLAELRMIQEQSGQLRALIATIEESLKALNMKLDQQADATRKGFADQRLQIDSLRDNVGVLREKVDDTNVRIATLSHEVETLRTAVGNIQTAPAPVNVPAGDPAGPPVNTQQPAGAQTSAPGMGAQRLFDTAMSDYLSGEFQLAISGFDAYIREYATGPKAAQAQYYVGESQFQLQQYQDAVTAYSRVIQNYKGSPWESEALYKRGRSFEQLKDPAQARQAYETLIRNFPADNAAVVLARQRLQALPR